MLSVGDSGCWLTTIVTTLSEPSLRTILIRIAESSGMIAYDLGYFLLPQLSQGTACEFTA